MKQPKNQKQLVLWYLIRYSKFSLLDVIKDSMCYKFPARLSELEQEYGKLAHRTSKSFVNRFGHKSSYYLYTALDVNKLKDIYDDL